MPKVKKRKNLEPKLLNKCDKIHLKLNSALKGVMCSATETLFPVSNMSLINVFSKGKILHFLKKIPHILASNS